jgi:Domain of unknown function (DUF4037)
LEGEHHQGHRGSRVTEFIPGIDLAGRFYREAVQPIIHKHFPDLKYSAGLIGSGSEVLGFDTERSSDHHWGPRVRLFMDQQDLTTLAPDLDRIMAEELPIEVAGYPTNFGPGDEIGVRLMRPVERGPVAHRVESDTLRNYLHGYIGVGEPESLSSVDWLITPQQKLRTLSHGPVFHDGLGELQRMRVALSWYPDAIWRALLAAQWGRIGQEEAFPGRCAEVGDELGSRLVTARLVWDLMRLFFLMERTYAPYSKWVGTAFSRLHCASSVAPALSVALKADNWPAREEGLVAAYRSAAEMQNALKLADPLPTEPGPFFGRPFRVIHGGDFASSLARGLDDSLLTLASRVGGVDQWVDSTDVLSHSDDCRRTFAVYVREKTAS